MTATLSVAVRPPSHVRQIGHVLAAALSNNPKDTLPRLLAMGVGPTDIIGGRASATTPDTEPSVWRLVVTTGDQHAIALLATAACHRRQRMSVAARRHETRMLTTETLRTAMGGINPDATVWNQVRAWHEEDDPDTAAADLWCTLSNGMIEWFDNSLPSERVGASWIETMHQNPGHCPSGWWEPSAPGGAAVRAAFLRRHADALGAWVVHAGRSPAPTLDRTPWSSLLHQAWGSLLQDQTAHANTGPCVPDDAVATADWRMVEVLLNASPHAGDPNQKIRDRTGCVTTLEQAILTTAATTQNAIAARILASHRRRHRCQARRG